MSQQLYRVTCGCGNAHDVTAGAAGGSLPCACGKAVEVPVLSKLRETVVRSSETPLTEFDAKRRTGQLPVERECVKCGCRTDHAAIVRVRCKQKFDSPVTVKSGLEPVMHLTG